MLGALRVRELSYDVCKGALVGLALAAVVVQPHLLEVRVRVRARVRMRVRVRVRVRARVRVRVRERVSKVFEEHGVVEEVLVRVSKEVPVVPPSSCAPNAHPTNPNPNPNPNPN